MKKLMLLAICLMALTIGCKNKGQTSSADGKDSLSAVVDSIIEDSGAPLPMFLMCPDEGKYLLMLYWANIDEPQKTEDNAEWFDEWYQSWALQDMFRSNASEYTNLITDKGIVKVKYVDEVLKDPDGNTPSIGEIHGRNDIPSLCARYEYADIKDAKGKLGGVVVTDSYLESHQRLDVEGVSWEKSKPLPEAAVKKLEQKYGMKAERSSLYATIGKDYLWGLLQFEGEYKNAPKDPNDDDRKSALALDVLIKGDEVFVNEEIGYYDEQYGATWNADDGGEYVGCYIHAAFEGPKGLEIFYVRSAPESTAIGMFFQRDQQLVAHHYETYHNMIDEEIPVWKKDFAQMDKIYHADERGDKDVKLTKWSHCYIDYENEWIWLRDDAENNGAFFIRDNDKFKLIAVENPNLKPTRAENGDINYLKLAGPAGGPSWQQEIHAFKNGKRIWKLNVLEVEGELNGCSLNDKEISIEEGQAYLEMVPEGKEIYAWFKDINPKEE